MTRVGNLAILYALSSASGPWSSARNLTLTRENSMARPVFAVLFCCLAFVALARPADAIVIDDFSVGEIVIDGPATQDQAGLDPAHVLGGSRRIQLGQSGNGSHIEIADDQFNFNSVGWGYFTLTYGAVESLGGVNLTQEGHDRLRIKFGSVGAGFHPFGVYVNLSPNSSSNGWSVYVQDSWDDLIVEIPYAKFPTSFNQVQKITIDAFRNPAGSGFSIDSIETAGPSVAGDFNRDGLVNGDDLQVWQRQLGVSTGNGSTTAFIATADANLDGRVDGTDFLAWQSTAASLPSGANAIPEPASWLATVVSALGIASLAGRC